MPETGSLRDRMTTSTRCAVGVVEGEQLLTSENATPGLAACVEPLELQLHVGAVVVGLEVLVLLLEVEQRARRDRDDELTVQ